MAFQPQGGQEVQNRKILQDLQERKRLMMNQQSPATNISAMSGGHPSRPGQEPAVLRNENHQLTVNQRQALEQAHTMSPGCYVTQDSLFGNLIIPVIPRIENDS